MLIAMAGLPGTGKSTIARALADHLKGVLLDKDTIRAALFPPEDIEYSAEQDDFCIDIIFRVSEYLLRKNPDRYIVLDGRTFSKRYQVEGLITFASRIEARLKIIECIVSDEEARRRLDADQAHGGHLAANRSFALYQALKAQAHPIEQVRLVIDTGKMDVATSIQKALAYIREG